MDRWTGRRKDRRTDGQTDRWTGVGEGRGGEKRGESVVNNLLIKKYISAVCSPCLIWRHFEASGEDLVLSIKFNSCMYIY